MVEISEVTFSEYHWNGTSWTSSSNYYVMDGLGTNAPPPSDIQKDVKCEWRCRHSGTANLKKKWWRHRRTEILRIKGYMQFGLADDAQRLKMEALVTRNSLFKVSIREANISTLQSPKLEEINGKDAGSRIPSVLATDMEESYYIFIDSSFTLPTGKRLIEYSLSLERVDLNK